MLNKKTLILSAVALVFAGNVKADDIKIGGRVKSQYTYKNTETNTDGIYDAPVNFKLNFTKQIDENVSGYVGFNSGKRPPSLIEETGDYIVEVEEAFLIYKSNFGKFQLGKIWNSFSVASFASSNAGALNGNVNGSFNYFDTYLDGISYSYSVNGVGIYAGIYDNNVYTTTFSYLNNGFNIRGGVAVADDVKHLTPGGDSKYQGIEDNADGKYTKILTYSSDISYSANGLYFGGAYTSNNVEYKKEGILIQANKDIIKSTYSGTLLFAIGGDFDDSSNLKAKRDNAFYFGGAYVHNSYGKDTVVKVADDIRAENIISGVIGFAPKNNIRIVLQYDNIKAINGDKTNQVTAQARVFF
jgi:hypothetical protein